MRTRTRARAAALALAILGVTSASPATAAPPGGSPGGPDDEQQLLFLRWSASDPWSDTLSGALFTDAHSPIVPGDSPERSFYAFNNTGDRAELVLACTIEPVGEDDAELVGSLDVLYNVNTASSGFRSCKGNPDPFPVSGRSANEVAVQLSLPDSLQGSTAMNQSATYSITVTLRQTTRGSRPPRVLGTQTLVAEPAVSESSSTSGTTSSGTTTTGTTTTGTTTTGTTTSSGGKVSEGKPTPTKTTRVAAPFRGEDGAVTESVPLIATLLVAGALMAGFRRRRREAD